VAMPKNIDIVRNGARSVVQVRGDIDWSNAPQLRAAILELFEKRRQQLVVVDLKEVRRVESSGVSILVEALQTARKRNARLVLCGLNESVRRALDLTRLTSVFEITDTAEQALTIGSGTSSAAA
jgi:anti-sigma B factor antagonist